jgi:hypothetical protein
LPPFIFFLTNYPELNFAVQCPNEGRRSPKTLRRISPVNNLIREDIGLR